MDLRDLFSDDNPLSPRYVLALIIHLPTNGAFYASRRGGPQFRGWDEDRYALVSAVNAINTTNFILAMANRDPSKSKPKAPKPFPTPDTDEKDKAPKPGSFASIATSMIAAQRKKKELLNG